MMLGVIVTRCFETAGLLEEAAVVSLETCWLTDGSVIRGPLSGTVKAAVAGNTGRKLRWYSPGRK